MYPKKDLRTTRLAKGLTAKDLCIGVIRPATISQVENGKTIPRKSTRLLIEGVIGPVSWTKTLSGNDRGHLMFALSEFVSINEPGARERIQYAQKALRLLSETTQKI